MGNPCWLVDIDGTIADGEHRIHHIKNGNRRWNKYFAEMWNDKPIEPIVTLLRDLVAHRPEHQLVMCSGRPDTYKGMTTKWLGDHRIPFAAIYMRPEGDKDPDNVVKSRLLDQILADGWSPIGVFDDRPRVIKMWRDRGLYVFDCNQTGEDF